jgi:hypothetical protein
MSSGDFTVIASETKEIVQMSNIEFREAKKKLKIPFYEMGKYKDNKATDADLSEYLDMFTIWIQELKDNDIYKIDVLSYDYLYDMVYKVFSNISGFTQNDTERIDSVEAKWIDSCYNSGVKYCDPDYIGNNYALDYSFNYPRIMSLRSFDFPLRRGKEHALNAVNLSRDPTTKKFTLQHGFYRMKIESTHKDITKLFSFSKDNVYLHVTLQHALYLKEKGYIDSIELVQDGKPNAYLYDQSCIINGQRAVTFSKWFDIISKLKAQFPKNRIVKLLGSMLHGVLASCNKKFVTRQELRKHTDRLTKTYDFENAELHSFADIEKDYYEVVEKKNPFKYNVRIKAWIHAHARNKISRLALSGGVHNVVRVNVDCVVFKTDKVLNFDKSFCGNAPLDLKTLKLEDKYTGFGRWKNLTEFVRYGDNEKLDADFHHIEQMHRDLSAIKVIDHVFEPILN